MNILIGILLLIVVLCLPHSWQTNVALDNAGMVHQMVMWGFDYFNTAVLPLKKGTLKHEFRKAGLPDDTFDLVNCLMSGVKNHWTSAELHQILSIGEKFRTTGRSEERIVRTVVDAILEGTLDETEVTRYKNMSRPVMLGLNVLSSLFISTNGNNTQLQLDGSKIFAGKEVTFLKYFLTKTKDYDDIIINNFKITKECANLIKNCLRERKFSFYSTNNYAKVDYHSEFPVDLSKLHDSDYFRVVSNKIGTLPVINQFPKDTSFHFDIYHTEIQKVFDNILEIKANLPDRCSLDIRADFGMEAFDEIHKRIVTLNLKKGPGFYGISNKHVIQLFTSADSNCQFQRLFSTPECHKSDSKLYVDLRYGSFDDSYLGNPFSYDTLQVLVAPSSNYTLLSTAFERSTISVLDLDIRHLTEYDELFENISNRQIKSLYLIGSDGTDGLYCNFVSKLLTNTPLSNGLIEFDCRGIPYVKLFKLFNTVEPKFDNLGLFLEDYDSELLNVKPIESVKRLFVYTFCSPDHFQQLINQLFRIFPNLESFRISSKENFPAFSVEGAKNLHSLVVECFELGDEIGVVKRLLALPQLTSVNIWQFHRTIRWKKQDGRIYYQL